MVEVLKQRCIGKAESGVAIDLFLDLHVIRPVFLSEDAVDLRGLNPAGSLDFMRAAERL
jgi:hypothetical protein